MIVFAWNLILALAWVALWGAFSLANFIIGFVVGFVALRIVFKDNPAFSDYFGRVPRIISFIGFFIYDLIKANLRVAYDVVTPQHHMRPGVVGIPLDIDTDREITMLANLITVTPGTLSLDVSSDRRVLYIHAMYIDDEDALVRDIKELERRVHEILR